MAVIGGAIVGFSVFIYGLEWRKPKLNLKFKQFLSVALLVLTLSASVYSGYYYVNNAPLAVNDSVTINSVGITQAVTWINTNVPQNSTIASNNPVEFPFYLSLSSKNYSIVSIPTSLSPFLTLITNKQIDYLVIFESAQINYFGSYPYIQNFIDNAPPGMCEVYRTTTFVVYTA
jgi:hypothetical protein